MLRVLDSGFSRKTSSPALTPRSSKSHVISPLPFRLFGSSIEFFIVAIVVMVLVYNVRVVIPYN